MADDKKRWSFLQAIYEEPNAGRAVATSVALSVGFLSYSVRSDWVMGAWATVAAFPVCWVFAELVRTPLQRWNQKRREKRRMKSLFESLGDEERTVVEGFVRLGGRSIRWGERNRRGDEFPANGIESLMSRGLLDPSTNIVGTETFELDEDLFVYAKTVVYANPADLPEPIPF